MTDPIERVARTDSQTVMDLVSSVTNAIAEHDTDLSRSIAAVSAMQDFLDKRNVPIWALLSGEMVAVPVEPNDAMLRAPWHMRSSDCEDLGPTLDELQESTKRDWQAMLKQAQLDYAGNPPVTPADVDAELPAGSPSEPAGATHSEKWPATWPLDRD